MEHQKRVFTGLERARCAPQRNPRAMAADDRGLAGLSQFRDFRTRQCIPGIELRRNRADRRQKLFFAEIAAPPPGPIELDGVRTPLLDEPAPLPGNSARIPNFDFAGHDRRNEYARNDNAIRLLRGRNELGAVQTENRPAPKVS